MSTFGNREILIKYEELPKINGVYIETIYTKAYDTRGIKDYTVRPEDASYYYLLYPYFRSDEPIRTRTLPKEIATIFDNVQEAEMQYSHKGEKKLVRIKPNYIRYRTHDSGHGGFIDDSIEIEGRNVDAPNSNPRSISFTRNSKCDFDLKPNHPVAQLMLNTLNIEAEVEVLNEWEYTYYPSTCLRRVDNWNYPTPVCSGWRRGNKMPYVSLDNKKSLRVLNEDLKAHVFLLKVEPEEVQEGEEYVIVTWGYQSDSEPDKYCFIHSWAHTHETSPNGMIHYRVDKIKKDKVYSGKVAECTVMEQKIKKYANKECSLDSFYRIVRIVNTEDLNN